MSNTEKLLDVSVVCKANIYFEGKVVSHTVMFNDGQKKTIGLIYPGIFNFNTGASEKMEIISGECRVKLPGHKEWKVYHTGEYFIVPGSSSFEIAVDRGIAEYLCSYEK